MKELLPCPFCGKADELKEEVEAGCWIECQRCMAAGPAAETMEGGRENWNRRAPSPSQAEREAADALIGELLAVEAWLRVKGDTSNRQWFANSIERARETIHALLRSHPAAPAGIAVEKVKVLLACISALQTKKQPRVSKLTRGAETPQN